MAGEPNNAATSLFLEDEEEEMTAWLWELHPALCSSANSCVSKISSLWLHTMLSSDDRRNVGLKLSLEDEDDDCDCISGNCDCACVSSPCCTCSPAPWPLAPSALLAATGAIGAECRWSLSLLGGDMLAVA